MTETAECDGRNCLICETCLHYTMFRLWPYSSQRSTVVISTDCQAYLPPPTYHDDDRPEDEGCDE